VSEADDAISAPEQRASDLLDDVMRGQRLIWTPPGSWSFGLFIVCVACGVVAIAFMGCSIALPLRPGDGELAPLLWPLGVAQSLALVAIVAQLRIVFGHAGARRFLIAYVRVLIALVAGLAVWLALSDSGFPAVLASIGTAALLASHVLLHSYAYQVVTAFCALKRRYRESAGEQR
jgi:hypothetical protein